MRSIDPLNADTLLSDSIGAQGDRTLEQIIGTVYDPTDEFK